jgi:N-methylhydantoinase A
LDGISEMQNDSDGATPPIEEVVHGSTVATNAVLERKGARTGLVNSAGLRDLLEIGRQNRPQLYNLEPRRPVPLVPQALRYEVQERIDSAGEVITPLQQADIELLLDKVVSDGVESLAVSLLFSYLNPSHEALIAAAARSRGLAVSISSELAPEYREYERASTTVVNAFVGPTVSGYVARLETGLQRTGVRRLRIVQSDGGSAGATAIIKRPVTTVLSGPAAGVAGAFAAARLAGFDHIISFDMGGTSTDIALCPGRILDRLELDVGGLPLRVPSVDVHTVGAGGGSLARIDAGGALKVGPESAGADPGPACYGHGEQATVTDAQLVLGRLQAEHFLGGRIRLQPARAFRALDRLGGSARELAAAIVRVANANMERAIRVISVERGYDPREFTLVAFGGAGPLHACELAEMLRIPRVLIPPWPGVLSAFGMVTAPVTRVYQRAIMRAMDPASGNTARDVLSLAAELESEGREDLSREGYDPEQLTAELSLDMRYSGQSYEIGVPLPATGMALTSAMVASAFHQLHRQQYGHADEARTVEIVNLRCRVIAPGLIPELAPPPKRDGTAERAHVASNDQWYAAGGWSDAPVYIREMLGAGDRFEGPAVVAQMDATTAIPPGWTAHLDSAGNIVIEA